MDKAGRYRISIGTRHWIDVVDGGQFIKAHDFLGSHECPWPHKIVDFELPAGRELILQFSGSTEASVMMAITQVGTPDRQ